MSSVCDKIYPSDAIRSMLFAIAKLDHGKIYIDNSVIVHICGLASKEDKEIRNMFVDLKIFFNLDNMPIDSRKFDEIMANAWCFLVRKYQFVYDREYIVDDNIILMQAIEYFKKQNLIDAFDKMIYILSYYNKFFKMEKSIFYSESLSKDILYDDITKTA